MATYKVIQDIEAEDKLLGPLTLRQFIYASIVVGCGFLAFRIALVNWLVALPLLPPIFFFGLLAAPFGKDQPTEVWLLAKIKFYLKPRRRIWNQTGIKELVTITAPKVAERPRTKDYSQTEVKSRLKALANTIDSRGWAVKNVNVNLFNQPAYATDSASDRLLDNSGMPMDVSSIDVTASDDMLDERNNPTAQNLDRLIAASSQAHRQQIVQQMKTQTNPAKQNDPPADYWFMNQNQQPAQPGYTTPRSKVVAPKEENSTQPKITTAEERKLLDKIHDQKEKESTGYGHMTNISPLSTKPKQPASPTKSSAKPTDTPKDSRKKETDPAIIDLAGNDDLNVETIARQANKRRKEPPADEVVVSLH